MNQKEIAKKAGVSVATISRVINGEEGVSQEKRQKILELLDKYAYVRDINAKNLRTSRSKAIGFLISNFENPFFVSMYQGLEAVCRKNGYNIIIGNTNEDVRQEQEAIDLFLSYRVAGIVASFVDPQETTLRKIKNFGSNIIALDRQQKNIEADTVTMDSFTGAKMQVEYLAGLGHKRIAVIHGTTNNLPGEERLNGYMAAMEEHSLKVHPNYVVSGFFNEEDAYTATVQLMGQNPRPTAVITHNNLMCIGAYKALKDLNIRIPQDVSLIGFDDFDFADYLEPSLTLIDRPLKTMGEIAGKMLIERIEGKYSGKARLVVFPAKLRVNHSCTRLGQTM